MNKNIFPKNYKVNQLSDLISQIHNVFIKSDNKLNRSRLVLNNITGGQLLKKYSNIKQQNQSKFFTDFIGDFFSNIPRWRSPFLEYNIGSAINSYASALYAIALDENIINTHEGLAGNTMFAEKTVVNILADFAKLKTKPVGLFTFGGTATNLYALRIGIKKALTKGIKLSDMYILITEDAHFSHQVSCDWLGIEPTHVWIIKKSKNNQSLSLDAQEKIKMIMKKGGHVATIIINGGTTYDQTIDNILQFRNLINKLLKQNSRMTKPHLHVDSVIGWSWLFMSKYDFNKNPLKINGFTLQALKSQYQKIKNIKLADSWGVDFHKGIGACPAPCSIIMINKSSDISFISKVNSVETHQLGKEEFLESPVDYTLETTRSAGPALSALISLHTLGINGYIKTLSSLVESSLRLKELLSKYKDIVVMNKNSKGFATMVRLLPFSLVEKYLYKDELGILSDKFVEVSESINRYNQAFYKWYRERLVKSNYRSFDFSYSKKYIENTAGVSLGAIKLYPVSPFFSKKYCFETVKYIRKLKNEFDLLYNKNE